MQGRCREMQGGGGSPARRAPRTRRRWCSGPTRAAPRTGKAPRAARGARARAARTNERFVRHVDRTLDVLEPKQEFWASVCARCATGRADQREQCAKRACALQGGVPPPAPTLPTHRVGGRRVGVRLDRKRPFSARASTISTRQALRVMTNGTRTGWRRPCARRGGQYGPVKKRDA